MKKFDFELVEKIIAEAENLVYASVGMKDDWFFTAVTVWENGKYEPNFRQDLGLDGSNIDTPSIKLIYSDQSEVILPCFTEPSIFGNLAKKATKQLAKVSARNLPYQISINNLRNIK